MQYYHVDVFTTQPMQGNGLTVVFPKHPLETAVLQKIAQEFKQFETIFIFPQNTAGNFPVRIFTVEEELAFAGHPILGAAAVLHHRLTQNATSMHWHFQLPDKVILVNSEYHQSYYEVRMNQGRPKFIQTVALQDYASIATSLNLQPEQLAPGLPLEVISTGLPYLIVPICNGLDTVKIINQHFEQFLHRFSAKYVYIFDVTTLECRTWNNSGLYEDVATGSAAGPLCAYLVQHGLAQTDTVIRLSQGKYLSRPSVIQGWVEAATGNTYIQGQVAFFGAGEILD